MLNIIATCAENGVIGRAGARPWEIAEDNKFLHDRTAGQTCVVGRRTFEKWPRATYDGRQSLVVTTQMFVATRHPWETESFLNGPVRPPMLLPSLTDALVVAEMLPAELYVCGGERIYREALAQPPPLRLHLTLVHAEVPGDAHFPDWRAMTWHETARRESSDENHRYSFLTLER